jgi:DNA-binding XRE family transcriptional regulator
MPFLQESGLALPASHLKKLEGNIWELRPEYNGIEYRLLFGHTDVRFVSFMRLSRNARRRREQTLNWRNVVSATGGYGMMAKSDFDKWLEEEMADPEFRAIWEETAPAEQFGLAVALAREARNLTQEELATATGIKRPMIARIEKGNQAPTMPTVLKFVRAFDASLEIDPSGRMHFATDTTAKRGQPIPAR